MDFPRNVKSTPCEYRSQTVITRDQHGITSNTVKVSNRDLPMTFEKKMSANPTRLVSKRIGQDRRAGK